MESIRIAILIYCFIGFASCNNNTITTNDIDEFISKYNDVKFDEIKDISISQRSKNLNEVTYVIGKFDGNKPVYFATYNLIKEKIININKSNLEKTNTKEYLTENEILIAVKTIRKYNFYSLSVDSFENIYINPFYATEPPYFLRLRVALDSSEVKKGYVYELHKKNWYLNKTRRKN